jgi:prevent-host-death family protein
MTKTISTIDVRRNLGDLLNRVALRHDEYVIERKGKPLAVMLPVEKLEQLRHAARLQLSRVLAAPSALNQAAADRLADEAKRASRKSRG